MKKHKVLLITGPGGDAQGWGALAVTESMRDALAAGGFNTKIAWVETAPDFLQTIEQNSYDIVWSALYYLTARADIIGYNTDDALWVADLLDRRAIPYIGPNALTMKQLIHKAETHRILREHNVSAPVNCLIEPGDAPPAQAPFPAFVKPCCESRSVGISDESVVRTPAELARQIRYIHAQFNQAALVEEYLPGAEYTALMLGNGAEQEFLPGLVSVDETLYGKYRILRSDLRGVGATKISIPATKADAARELARQATDALRCYDHVRVDMRMDSHDELKIIEVNGIPGLKPLKSWSPQLYALYHPTANPADGYRAMLCHIVRSALMRYNIFRLS